MSARGRKAQLVPPKSAIAVELDQELEGLLEDMEELISYCEGESIAHFEEGADNEREVIDFYESLQRSGTRAAFLG